MFKCEHLTSAPEHSYKKSALVACACNLDTWKQRHKDPGSSLPVILVPGDGDGHEDPGSSLARQFRQLASPGVNERP